LVPKHNLGEVDSYLGINLCQVTLRYNMENSTQLKWDACLIHSATNLENLKQIIPAHMEDKYITPVW